MGPAGGVGDGLQMRSGKKEEKDEKAMKSFGKAFSLKHWNILNHFLWRVSFGKSLNESDAA